MTDDLKLQDLSKRAQNALRLVLAGRPLTLDGLRTLSQRDIWIMPGYGRETSNEIRDWAKGWHGIEMPEGS